MKDKEAEEIKAELRRIERENQKRRDNTRAWIIVAVIIAIVAFAFWNNQRINGNTPDPGSPVDCSSHPYDANC